MIGEYEQTALIVDDKEFLDPKIDLKVVEINVYIDEKKEDEGGEKKVKNDKDLAIYGFNAVYKSKSNPEDENLKGVIICHNKNIENCKVETLKINPDDKLKFISGFYSNHIEYLKFETSKGKNVIVGTVPSKKQGKKQFHFEVKRDENVNSFIGALDYNVRKGSKDKGMVLVGLGIRCGNFIHESEKIENFKNENFATSFEESYTFKRGTHPIRMAPLNVPNYFEAESPFVNTQNQNNNNDNNNENKENDNNNENEDENKDNEKNNNNDNNEKNNNKEGNNDNDNEENNNNKN